MYFKTDYPEEIFLDTDCPVPSLDLAIKKTRDALDRAYTGFDNALDFHLIDSYIYQINSLQERYAYLLELKSQEVSSPEKALSKHSTIRTLVSQVFG